MRQSDLDGAVNGSERKALRVFRSVARGVVFVVGALFGYLMAQGFASFPGGAPRVVVHLRIYGTLALTVAAPVCWYFAVRGKAGDRWTLGYLAAWALWSRSLS